MTKEKFEELIASAIGEASMCWSDTPSGVFDSSRALDLVKKIMNSIPTVDKNGQTFIQFSPERYRQ